MADTDIEVVGIHELPAVTNPARTDELPVNHNGSASRIQLGQIIDMVPGGGGGEDGGYYSPNVTQPSENVMRMGFNPSKASMPTVQPVDINLPSGAGEDGGYYQPSVTQPSENVMRMGFNPSKSGMPAVQPVDITLPSGGSGGGLPPGWITPQMYGAVGNSKWYNDTDRKYYSNSGLTTLAADDTAAFQAMLDACPEGGVCYIPTGNYLITDELIVKKQGITIRGENAVKLGAWAFSDGKFQYNHQTPKGSVLKFAPQSNNKTCLTVSENIAGSPSIYAFAYIDSICIVSANYYLNSTGFTPTAGNPGFQYEEIVRYTGINGLKLCHRGSSNVRVNNLYISGFSGIGIDNIAQASIMEDCIITQCSIGVRVTRNDIILQHPYISRCGVGIYVYYLNISGTTITEPTRNSSMGFSVYDCWIDECLHHAVESYHLLTMNLTGEINRICESGIKAQAINRCMIDAKINRCGTYWAGATWVNDGTMNEAAQILAEADASASWNGFFKHNQININTTVRSVNDDGTGGMLPVILFVGTYADMNEISATEYQDAYANFTLESDTYHNIFVGKGKFLAGASGGGGGGVTVHNELTGRDATGAHPWTAISGLKEKINVHNGKAVFFGDSMLQGYNSKGDGHNWSYANALQERGIFDDVSIYGVGGTTFGDWVPMDESELYPGWGSGGYPYVKYSLWHWLFTNPSGRPEFAQAKADIAAAKYVFIEYGANDLAGISAKNVPLGTIQDSPRPSTVTDPTQSTVCATIKACIQEIYRLNPAAIIIYLDLLGGSCVHMYSNGFLEYFDQNLGAGVADKEIRLFQDIFIHENCRMLYLADGISFTNAYRMSDLTHANEAGHNIFADRIISSMDDAPNYDLPSVFEVNFTTNSGMQVTGADKTFTQIRDAFFCGRYVAGKLGGTTLHLVYNAEDAVAFQAITSQNGALYSVDAVVSKGATSTSADIVTGEVTQISTGGAGGVSIVNITFDESSGTGTSNKSPSEIHTAVTSGIAPYLLFNGMQAAFISMLEDLATFQFSVYDENLNQMIVVNGAILPNKSVSVVVHCLDASNAALLGSGVIT